MASNKNMLQQTSTGVPKFALLLIALLVAILAAVLLMARQAPAPPNPGAPDFVQAAEVFTPGQPLTITAENITIYVPKDSLNLPGTISVASQEPNLFPAADQPDWTRPQIVEVLFLNTQATPVHRIIFANPVHVCFRLMPEQWQDYSQRPDAYQVQDYAVENDPQVWQSLPMTAYAETTMLCGETMHFSLFALAIRVDLSIPVTGLTPTSGVVQPVVRPTREQPAEPAVILPTSPPPTAAEILPTTPPTDPPPTDVPPGASNRKQCNDGQDNDSDGLTDLDDPGCRNHGDDNEDG